MDLYTNACEGIIGRYRMYADSSHNVIRMCFPQTHTHTVDSVKKINRLVRKENIYGDDTTENVFKIKQRKMKR